MGTLRDTLRFLDSGASGMTTAPSCSLLNFRLAVAEFMVNYVFLLQPSEFCLSFCFAETFVWDGSAGLAYIETQNGRSADGRCLLDTGERLHVQVR